MELNHLARRLLRALPSLPFGPSPVFARNWENSYIPSIRPYVVDLREGEKLIFLPFVRIASFASQIGSQITPPE
jgi:hypothetical protein